MIVKPRDRVAHVTILHNRYDTRIFQKECVSLSSRYDVILIVNDHLGNEVTDRISIVDLNLRRGNRFIWVRNSVNRINEILEDVRPRIVHIHDPELLWLYCKTEQKFRFVFDLHDDLVLQVLEKEYIPRFLRKLVSWCSSIFLTSFIKRIDGLITAADYMTDKYKCYNPRSITIWNYPIISKFKPKAEFRLEKQIKILFIGTAYTGRSLENLCEVITEPEFKEAFCLTIIGEVSELLLGKLRCFLQAGNIEILPPMKYAELYDIIQFYDIGFICDYKFERNEQIIPIKILEYMAAGLPIIGSSLSKVKSIIQESANGFIVDLDQENDSIRAILRQILSCPQKLKELGTNSFNSVKDYDWSKMEFQLKEFYDEILSDE